MEARSAPLFPFTIHYSPFTRFQAAPSMLWLAVHFPSLALDVFARGTRAHVPLAIASSPGNNATVFACNRLAHGCGVRPGMPLAAACALASGLKVLARDVAQEHAAAVRVAAWAIRFTPTVSIAPPDGILLEVAGSLRLFGGLARLRALIERGLAEFGYGTVLACAPTPLAAQLFARAGLVVRIQHRDALRHALEKLPLEVLGQPPGITAALRDIGVGTIGECLRLPRDGVARRLGQSLIDGLDRALGDLPDPRPGFAPPAQFAATLPLPAPVHEAQALLFAARRLLAELCGFLAATGNGVQRLGLALAHEDRAGTHLALNFVAASRDPGHLASVVRERLARTDLPCPVTAITLASELLVPVAAHNLSFLPDAGSRLESAARLVERLRARLGDAAVAGLATVPDHRPEYAWQVCEPGRDSGEALPRQPDSRPLWLLASPRPLREDAGVPCYQGPLTLLTGPERIESGWWDGNDVARDYFIARNPDEALLWVYRERSTGGGWYLHGFFS
jgi:protein ImuB